MFPLPLPTPRRKPVRRGLLGSLVLAAVLVRLKALNERGAHAEMVRIGEGYHARWKGSSALYLRLAGAHWALSHWRDAIAHGRRALTLDPGCAQAAVFLLAAYRSENPLRGIAFGEAWQARRPLTADVSRHLAFLYDDLDRHVEALAVARRGLERFPRNARLAACTANFLAKVEGAASALRFAADHRRLFAGDAYCDNTLANGLSAVRAYPEAEAIFARLHRDSRHDAGVFHSLLDTWYHQGRYEEIVTAVTQWQQGLRVTAAIANETARALLELGRHDEAMRWMQQAVDLAPESGKYADNHAVMLGRVGRHAEGVEAGLRRLAAPGAPDRRRLLTSIAVDYSLLGRHEEAMTYYERAFAEFPANDEALVNVIVGLSWLRRYDEGVAFGLRHRETRGPGLPPRYWSELAWALHCTGRFAEEENVIREWHRFHPHDPETARTLKRALNQLGRRDDALAFTRAWVDAHPSVAWGWLYLAEQLEVCEQSEAELAALAEASRLAPTNATFVDAQLSTLRRLARPQAAFDRGAAWVAAHAGDASASLLNRIGLAADDLEQWPAAEDYYRRAHQAAPQNGTFLGNLLRALICAGRAAEAAGLGRRWLAEHPWDNYVASKQAWALRTARLEAEETEVLQKAVAVDPASAELNHSLLISLLAQKRTAEAGEWLDRQHAAGTATSRMWNDWANHLREAGRWPESEAAYRQALAIAPDNDVPAGNLAALLVLLARADEAVLHGRAWLERRPADRYVRRQLANALYAKDDYAPAVPEYRTLLADEPASAFLVSRLVACLRLLDRFEEALDEGARWQSQHAGTSFLSVEMGIAAYRLRRLDDALAHYETALQLEPASVSAATRKLRVLGEQGRTALALDFGAQWSHAYPDAADADFLNDFGIILDQAGQQEKAESCFLRAAGLAPLNPTLAGNAVDILTRQKRVEEGVQLGQRFLASSPPNGYLLRRLAGAYSAQHEHLAALDLLASADALDPADADIAIAFLRTATKADELTRGAEFGRSWLARPSNQRHATVWSRFAQLCFRADHDEEAFNALQVAADLEPDEVAHVRLRFSFWNALGESTAVVNAFESVRPEWRDDPQLLRHASRAHHELGYEAGALDLATRNVDLNSADEDACAWLAELHDRSGRPATARESLRAWIEVHGEQPAVLKVRARFALEDKAFAAALRDAEQVLHYDDADEESFRVSVRALRALDRRSEARARLHHWLEHHDSSAQIARLLDDEPAEEAD